MQPAQDLLGLKLVHSPQPDRQRILDFFRKQMLAQVKWAASTR